ncbi:hypothetical protein [Vogesella sp. XCS3]|uniref:hypothetical protein n=1 Tax=Vogesella sp. XCS3 TaxID=2877939 RepID=UPI001D0B1181|nr:hypothetical protein [Vogesella sp. XCS3]UDM18932.1 hypothetical protein LCH97_17975 [Vogesella sp. XCS3]
MQNEKSAGYIQLTFVDEANNEFITLGGAGFLTDEDLKVEWDAVPAFEGKTSFIADLLDAERSIIDDRNVSAEFCEAKLGKPIAELIEAGRKELADELREHAA